MCIIQGDNPNVKKTRILVAPIDSFWQFTMYGNEVSFQSPQSFAAMILPVPSGADPELIDLSRVSDCLDVLSRYLIPPSLSAASFSITNSSKSRSDSYLEVTEVGSYLASVVPTLSDFHRIDPSVFVLDPTVFQVLSQYYPTDFQFVVCMLQQHKAYHPLGILHRRLPDSRLFLPTLHFHYSQASHQDHTDWDHEIFCCDSRIVEALPWQYQSPNAVDMSSLMNRSGMTARLPIWLQPKFSRIMAYQMTRYSQNHDLFAVAEEDSHR